MAVKIRERKLQNGGMHFQADIRVMFPDGTTHRERVKAPGRTRAAALRWARQREAHILRHGVPDKEDIEPTKHTDPIPTLTEFIPKFREAYIHANRLKPSSCVRWNQALKLHILPLFGDHLIDRIGAAEFQRLKLLPFAANTINGLIGNLMTILRTAREWGYAVAVPRVKLVKVPARLPEFYDFDAYRGLVTAARSLDATTYALVLLGGDAGLRTGEIIALHRSDLDLRRRLITVLRNEYLGHVGDPKGGSARQVPMTRRLKAALLALPVGGQRVLYRGLRWDVRGLGSSTLVVQSSAPRRLAEEGAPCPEAHILFPARHEGRVPEGDPDARWPRQVRDDRYLHAPVAADAS